MVEQCAFETSWYPTEESPWCKIFEAEEIKVSLTPWAFKNSYLKENLLIISQALEYYLDLEAYWVDSYGTKLSAEIVCVTFQDLITHLRCDHLQ